MNAAYEDVVTIFPPVKSPDGDAVLLKFKTRSGEMLRLGMSDSIARNLGTQLLLSAGAAPYRGPDAFG